MIEVQFDFHLFLIGLVIYYFIMAVANISNGAMKKNYEPTTHAAQIVYGLILLGLIVVCLIW